MLYSWVPYTQEVLALSTPADSAPGSNDLPLDVLARAAPSYNKALLDGQPSGIDLTWMRNKNIALLGSSFDRNALESFCGMHPGATAVVKELHRFAYCTIPVRSTRIADGIMSHGQLLTVSRGIPLRRTSTSNFRPGSTSGCTRTTTSRATTERERQISSRTGYPTSSYLFPRR